MAYPLADLDRGDRVDGLTVDFWSDDRWHNVVNGVSFSVANFFAISSETFASLSSGSTSAKYSSTPSFSRASR